MTIKDMELQTGLARANIRYYEAEGLITPERAENGYRDYSQEDAETLLRVKLLRALGLTVGQIKAVVRGETELDAALSARIAAIQKEKTALDRAGEIAGRIRQAHAQFRTLDARPYLDEMQTERVLERDTLPKEHFPWQRFFARLLDAQIYRSLWVLILPALGFNMLKSSRGGVLFLELLTLGTMFLLEPLLLSRFGTTPGKWLFGLRVTSPDGRRLTYAEGRERDELTKNFVAAYKEAYGETPIQFAADAYDGMYAIKAAVEKSGVTPDMSVSDICDAMETAMTEITVDGLTSKGMTWNADGEPNKEPKAVKIENGSYVSMDK